MSFKTPLVFFSLFCILIQTHSIQICGFFSYFRSCLISFCFHLGASALIALAAVMNEAGRIGALTALLFLAHGVWQSARLKSSREQAALGVFKSNIWAGAIVAIGFTLSAMAPEPRESTLFADHEIVPEGPPSTMSLPFGFKVKRAPPSPAEPGETWFASEALRALQKEGVAGPDTEEAPVQ